MNQCALPTLSEARCGEIPEIRLFAPTGPEVITQIGLRGSGFTTGRFSCNQGESETRHEEPCLGFRLHGSRDLHTLAHSAEVQGT